MMHWLSARPWHAQAHAAARSSKQSPRNTYAHTREPAVAIEKPGTQSGSGEPPGSIGPPGSIVEAPPTPPVAPAPRPPAPAPPPAALVPNSSSSGEPSTSARAPQPSSRAAAESATGASTRTWGDAAPELRGFGIAPGRSSRGLGARQMHAGPGIGASSRGLTPKARKKAAARCARRSSRKQHMTETERRWLPRQAARVRPPLRRGGSSQEGDG
jgi:hypothetical protein